MMTLVNILLKTLECLPRNMKVGEMMMMTLVKRAWSGSDHGGLSVFFFALMISKVGKMDLGAWSGLGAI